MKGIILCDGVTVRQVIDVLSKLDPNSTFTVDDEAISIITESEEFETPYVTEDEVYGLDVPNHILGLRFRKSEDEKEMIWDDDVGNSDGFTLMSDIFNRFDHQVRCFTIEKGQRRNSRKKVKAIRGCRLIDESGAILAESRIGEYVNAGKFQCETILSIRCSLIDAIAFFFAHVTSGEFSPYVDTANIERATGFRIIDFEMSLPDDDNGFLTCNPELVVDANGIVRFMYIDQYDGILSSDDIMTRIPFINYRDGQWVCTSELPEPLDIARANADGWNGIFDITTFGGAVLAAIDNSDGVSYDSDNDDDDCDDDEDDWDDEDDDD